jgi:predicted secreted protein
MTGADMSDGAIGLFIHYVVLFSAYAVLWFLCLFCLLPVGLGAERDPESGAPLTPMLGRKALIATGIAAVLWVGFYAAITLGWMQL